jgi:hypothetical protein
MTKGEKLVQRYKMMGLNWHNLWGEVSHKDRMRYDKGGESVLQGKSIRKA